MCTFHLQKSVCSKACCVHCAHFTCRNTVCSKACGVHISPAESVCSKACGVHCAYFTCRNTVCSKACGVHCCPAFGPWPKTEDMTHIANLMTQQNHRLQSTMRLSRWMWGQVLNKVCFCIGQAADDDDDGFYVMLISALKQTHCTFGASDSK